MENTNSQDKILEVKDLRISFRTNGGTVKAVRGISFPLYRGRTLAIVGESGSGKSVTSKAILGILAGNKIIEGGQIIYDGQDLLKIDEEHFHKIRGVKISMIFQDPLSSLNPIMIVGSQLTEAMKLKQKADQKEAKKHLAKINRIIKQKNLTLYEEIHAYLNADKKSILDIFKKKEEKEITKENKPSPFEKSEFKEVLLSILEEEMVSRTEASEKLLPELNTIVDESFIGDDTNIDEVIKKLKALYSLINKASIHVLEEKDNTIEVFPAIISDIKSSWKASDKANKNLQKALSKYKVDNLYALPPQVRATFPEVFKNHENFVSSLKGAINELSLHISNILKEKDSKKDFYLEEIYKEYLDSVEKLLHKESSKEIKERAIQMLKEVGIDEPERRFKQYPFELSGGMRQRIVIAIALCSSPEVLICDEPTTALDVTIQAQILELINKLKRERNLSIVFITHDLGVVANMADDIAVMYAGKIVEYGKANEVFYDPRHPYTWALLGSMPDLDTKEQLTAIPGTPPNMLLPPKGDAFAPRNAHALAIDQEEQPPFFAISNTHYAATWNLHPEAPSIEAPKIVKARIENALSKDPEVTPKPFNLKNSILNEIGGGK